MESVDATGGVSPGGGQCGSASKTGRLEIAWDEGGRFEDLLSE
jgi:hypothetical protein